jgi:hypothetical protein
VGRGIDELTIVFVWEGDLSTRMLLRLSETEIEGKVMCRIRRILRLVLLLMMKIAAENHQHSPTT